MKSIVLCSGGLDSAVLSYFMRDQGHSLHLLSFYYNQRHARELELSRTIAKDLNVPLILVHLDNVFSKSSLTGNIEVPENKHYNDPDQSSTIVPNRNAVFLTIAFAQAIAQQAGTVAYGAHAGDRIIYPDCRKEFVDAFYKMQTLSLGKSINLYTPFLEMSKTDIIRLGNQLKVPFEKTWTCYKGAERHCGACGACLERREGFIRANIVDPINYETNTSS